MNGWVNKLHIWLCSGKGEHSLQAVCVRLRHGGPTLWRTNPLAYHTHFGLLNAQLRHAYSQYYMIDPALRECSCGQGVPHAGRAAEPTALPAANGRRNLLSTQP